MSNTKGKGSAPELQNAAEMGKAEAPMHSTLVEGMAKFSPVFSFFTLALPAYASPHQNLAEVRAQETANTRSTAPAKGSQENVFKFMDAEEA